MQKNQPIQEQLAQQPLALLYLSQPNCSICVADKPRIQKLAQTQQLPLFTINTLAEPEAASLFSVLTVPVVLLLKYKFHQSNSIRISAAFDVNEDLVGRIVDGVPVYPMDDMKEQVKIQQIDVAILTVPAQHSQDLVNELVKAGIKGILNFTPARITAPKGVLIQNVDLTNELQTLIYFLHSGNVLSHEEPVEEPSLSE